MRDWTENGPRMEGEWKVNGRETGRKRPENIINNKRAQNDPEMQIKKNNNYINSCARHDKRANDL